MITGELPFNADTPWEIIRLHIDAKPTSVRRARADLPRGLDSVVDRCLEKNPDRRYQTLAEVAHSCRRRPSLRHPPDPSHHSQGPQRRRPGPPP